jgi:hypothetical protein
MKKIALLALSLLLNGTIYSQNDTAFILPKLKIYSNKTEYYSFEKYDYTRFFISNNFLKADPKKYEYMIKIDEINMLAFRDGTAFWPFAAVGASLGFLGGFLLGGFIPGIIDISTQSNTKFHFDSALLTGLFIAVPFSLVGGLIGLLAPTYDYYDINKISVNYKASYLKEVLKKKKITSFKR